MKRRHFALLSGSSFAVAVALHSARAQSAAPDASLLTTTLTPLGAERAGNADGSIPAWTGGVTSPALPPNQPVDVSMFADEQPLYTVDASNMAQYTKMLSSGTQDLMTKYGFRIKIYQTHRTAAAPQYVYDNTAQNVTRSKLEPAGGRFGFTGGYGGPPFPIIDTSDPETAGAQLIWNHLVYWGGYSDWTNFSASFVVTGGHTILTFGGKTRFICPYYDPNGSPETYEGYYSKLLSSSLAPASANGQETMVWLSSNTLVVPDIVWALLNGQGRVHKAPDEAYDTPNPAANGINNIDDANGFTGSPQEYDWRFIGRQEMLVPYNCNAIHQHIGEEIVQTAFLNPDIIRWEKHRMWVVEASLHPGEFNTTKRRRLYIDEDTWLVLLADCYDADDNLVKTTTVYNRCIPSLPGTIEQGFATCNLMSGDYTYVGSVKYAPYNDEEYIGPQSDSYFDPQQMAAAASF